MNSTTPNNLINEKSPYLQQHAFNPVNWYPWGIEAFEKAKNENKPIFLSIGYSTCHWCHVMAHESFENEIIAGYLNKYFISIKVDREERPEIDNIYMNICQIMNGNGGWPLTVFMDFNQKPFFVNTYFPPEDRHGRLGFLTLLNRINDIWQKDFGKIEQSIEAISNNMLLISESSEGSYLTKSVLDNAYNDFLHHFDKKKGGFGKAPKFPSPHNLLFLLNYFQFSKNPDALTIVKKTLTEMRYGGIFDQVGFGFHRYSTDENWLVPHFEKMLYDQAMLILAYSETYKTTKDEFYKKTAYEIIEYLKRDMLSPYGGFYSAEDADSEGIEGKFYVWTYDEIIDLLPPDDVENFVNAFNINPQGNYLDESKHIKNGNNILHLNDKFTNNTNIQDNLLILYNARNKKIHPLKDTKILTDWNGLIITSLAKAGTIFNDDLLINLASDCYNFIKTKLTTDEGLLKHRFIDNKVNYDATAEDYAFVIWGLIELYNSTLNADYLVDAVQLNENFIKYYWDETNNGFYFSPSNGEKLISRSKQFFDNAIPSSNSIALQNFIWLSKLTALPIYQTYIQNMLKVYGEEIEKYPRSFSMVLSVFNSYINDGTEIIIFENNDKIISGKYLTLLKKKELNNCSILLVTTDNYIKLLKIAPFLEGFNNKADECMVFICKNHQCNLPISNFNDFEKQIELI
ncbi:MAG: thioredoxin domain-containing protein [bacterium]